MKTLMTQSYFKKWCKQMAHVYTLFLLEHILTSQRLSTIISWKLLRSYRKIPKLLVIGIVTSTVIIIPSYVLSELMICYLKLVNTFSQMIFVP